MLLEAENLLKALSEEEKENVNIHKDDNDDHDFGKVLDSYKHTDTSYGEVMCSDGTKRNILYKL